MRTRKVVEWLSMLNLQILQPIIEDHGNAINALLGHVPISDFAIGRQVVMQRTADGGNDPSINPATWLIKGPDGETIDTAGSTTQGLQEAINYAAANGFDLTVLGGGVKPDGQDPSIISCTSTITFPPFQKGSVTFRSVTINIGGSPAVGMSFDSCMAFDFQWRGGQIVCGVNTSTGVLFKPINELPGDPAGPVITTSRFVFPSVVMLKADGVCVKFDVDLADIGEGNVFEFIEPNAGAYGIQVVGDAAHSFRGNKVSVCGAHAQTTLCVAVGLNATGAANIRGNSWDIECDPGPGAMGVDVWGQRDVYRVSVLNDEGPAAVGFKFNTSSSKNLLVSASLVATIARQDVSAAADNVVLGTT